MLDRRTPSSNGDSEAGPNRLRLSRMDLDRAKVELSLDTLEGRKHGGNENG